MPVALATFMNGDAADADTALMAKMKLIATRIPKLFVMPFLISLPPFWFMCGCHSFTLYPEFLHPLSNTIPSL